MKILRKVTWVSGSIAVFVGVLGCSVFVQRAPRETVYVESPPPVGEQPEYVIVREAPPAVIVERRSSPPGQGYIWIDGYWHWNSHRYEWQRGHWATPPHERAVWIAPRYERYEQGYRYTPGQWREEQREREREDEHHRDRH